MRSEAYCLGDRPIAGGLTVPSRRIRPLLLGTRGPQRYPEHSLAIHGDSPDRRPKNDGLARTWLLRALIVSFGKKHGQR